jgi:hypothetical protein
MEWTRERNLPALLGDPIARALVVADRALDVLFAHLRQQRGPSFSIWCKAPGGISLLSDGA